MDKELLLEEPLNQGPTKSTSIYQGMPPLERADQPLSFFEFWPSWLVYLPVTVQWVWLSIRYRGFTLPLVSNPNIHLSGMVGESKSDIFSLAEGEAQRRIAPWCLLESWDTPEAAVLKARDKMKASQLSFPVVAKPDIGCRGAGVRVIRSEQGLRQYIQGFPEEGRIMLQKLIPWEAEAGIFYIRYPGVVKGRIFSITFKYPPYVIGNGIDTLRQLIVNDERAGRLTHLYFKRHEKRLDEVIPDGQPVRLAFAGSHYKGAIFRDGREFITPAMTKAFDKVADGLPEFCYGRIDIRFKDIESLMGGENFYVLEVNGASSEAAHIWDCRSRLQDLYRVLFYQYRTLFQLGAINRRRGFCSPSILTFYRAWKAERELVKRYPDTE